MLLIPLLHYLSLLQLVYHGVGTKSKLLEEPDISVISQKLDAQMMGIWPRVYPMRTEN